MCNHHHGIILSSGRSPCGLYIQEFNLCLRRFLFALVMCVYVCPPGASSIRATTALAVEQEHTRSVWKWSPSVKSVGVSSNLIETLILIDTVSWEMLTSKMLINLVWHVTLCYNCVWMPGPIHCNKQSLCLTRCDRLLFCVWCKKVLQNKSRKNFSPTCVTHRLNPKSCKPGLFSIVLGLFLFSNSSQFC